MPETKEIKIKDIIVKFHFHKPKEEDIKELATHIKEHGLFRSLIVKYKKGKYILIDGLMRLEAVKQLNWKTVRCTIIHPNENALDKTP
jgi:ParB-like chromosome segregation protein Spo0J